MKKAQHTPGPWAVENITGDILEDIVLDYHVPGREHPIWIASVLSDDLRVLTKDEIAEIEANARLIAAAPEMFKLLDDILRQVPASGPLWQGSKTVGDIRAVLRKARGKVT